MSGILFVLDQQRLIDSLGISSGGQIFFYTSNTSVKAPIYADAALVTPLANPVVVDAGGTIPSVYLDPSVTYRRYIVYNDGSVDNVDPYANGGFLLAGPSGAGSVGVSSGVSYPVDTAGWLFNIGTSDYTDLPYDYFTRKGTTTDDQAFNDIANLQATKTNLGIKFPPRDITLGQSHTFVGAGLDLQAVVKKRTRIIVENNSRININPGLLSEQIPPFVNIDGLLFCTSGGIHTSGALKIAYGNNAVGSTAQPLMIRDCEFVGKLDTDGFTMGCEIRNAPNPNIHNVRIYGDRNNFTTPPKSVIGLAFTSDDNNAGGNAIVSGLQCNWMTQAVQITGHHEGMRFLEPTILVCRVGITQLGVTESGQPLPIPLLQVKGGFINATTLGVYFRNGIHADLQGTTYYSEGIPGDTTPSQYNAIVLENTSGLDMGSQVIGNLFDMVTGAATQRNAVSIIGSPDGLGKTDVMLSNLVKGAGAPTSGYNLGNFSKYVYVTANNAFNNVGTPVINSGTSNTIGSYQNFS